MRKVLLVLAITCALLTSCGSEGKVAAPFDAQEYKGKGASEIIEQLEKAGFTNIQTETQSTTEEFNADCVISVKIGNNDIWNEANTWKPDAPVTITYYSYGGIRHIEAIFDITVSGEAGKPQFTVNTNLPDGTVLNAELSYDGALIAGREDYMETQSITVQNGMAQTAPFTSNGEILTGNYLFYVLMQPAEQAETVQDVIGVNGEALRGDFVENTGEYQYIQTKMEYRSPFEEQSEEIEKISEEALENNFRDALVGFGDSYNITSEGYLYTVQVWQDGMAEIANKAAGGNQQSEEAWEKVVSTTLEATDCLQKLLESGGYTEYLVQVEVLNDQNLELTLLTTCLGQTVYNCVTDG